MAVGPQYLSVGSDDGYVALDGLRFMIGYGRAPLPINGYGRAPLPGTRLLVDSALYHSPFCWFR